MRVFIVYETTFTHCILKFHDTNINKRTVHEFVFCVWDDIKECGGEKLISFTIFHSVFLGRANLAILCEIFRVNYTFLLLLLLVLAYKPRFRSQWRLFSQHKQLKIEMNGNMCSPRFYKYNKPILSKHYDDCYIFNRRQPSKKARYSGVGRVKGSMTEAKNITRSLFSIIVMIFIYIYYMQPTRKKMLIAFLAPPKQNIVVVVGDSNGMYILFSLPYNEYINRLLLLFEATAACTLCSLFQQTNVEDGDNDAKYEIK